MQEKQTRLSIHESLGGKHILVTGGTGFLGKVLLAMLLDQVPTVGKIYLLIRSQKNKSAVTRFEAMINSHYVFAHLHEKFGANLTRYLKEKVQVLDGTIESPFFGLDDETASLLLKKVDLIINCAGLVDFWPDVRESFSANVTATLNAAEFCRISKRTKLLHISTCFVAGKREGKIKELIPWQETPLGAAFNPENEKAFLLNEIKKIEHTISKDISPMERKRLLREQCKTYGMSRATQLGWTNTYTYTKALTEALLTTQYKDIPFSILRPSVVEGSLTYPFPGWNDGFNTSGPLVYLINTWLRYLPVKKGNPFDLVPVDMVCKAMLAVSAALIKGQNKDVYHCGTSDLNMLAIDQSSQLTSLSHRIYYKRKGTTWLQRHVRSRWKLVNIGHKKHPLSTASLYDLHGKLERSIAKNPLIKVPVLRKPMHAALHYLRKNRKKLEQVQETLRLFKPFVLDHYQIFETKHLMELTIEEKEFRFNPQDIDWRRYFLDVLVPGLRRWCFPLIQREKIDTFNPRHPIVFHESAKVQKLAAQQRNA